MKKLFITFVILICIIPSAGMIFLGESPPGANEVAAVMPQFSDPEIGFNWKILTEFTDYIGKRFTFRQDLITVNSALFAKAFGLSAVDDIILGKEDWLFYERTLPDYFGENVLNDEYIAKISAKLKSMEGHCADNGKNFLFVIAPNKNSVYPQYMPYPQKEIIKNSDKLLKKLAEDNVSHINLFEKFAKTDDTIYHKWDSHWNNLGAAIACDEILSELNLTDENFSTDSYAKTKSFQGDLYNMLYPKGKGLDENIEFARKMKFIYDQPINGPDAITIKTTCEGKTGKVLVFRDSFGNALYPFIAESFSEAVFSRKTPYKIELADETDADTVIIIMAERNIAQFDKHIPIENE